MSQYRSIMLLTDSSLHRTPALERACQLAQVTGAALQIAVTLPHDADKAIDEQVRQASALAASCSASGIDVTLIELDIADENGSLLGRLTKERPDLVLKDLQSAGQPPHGRLTSRDRPLLRHCPAPLLLISKPPQRIPRTIIVAINVTDEHRQAPALHAELLHEALALALQCDAELRLVFAFDSLRTVETFMPGAKTPSFPVELYEMLLRLHRDDLLAFARSHDVPVDRCHFLDGPLDTALPRFAADQRADVLVLGSSHRTGFEHWLKGDTVERLLPHLSCDVLVVHPKSDEWIPSTRYPAGSSSASGASA